MNGQLPKATVVKPREFSEFHRAGWIISSADRVIQNGYIGIENGVIKEVSTGKPFSGCIDHGPGVLMPPLVNAHTHLELSFCQFETDCTKGFEQWVRQLIRLMEDADENQIKTYARKAAYHLTESGILYVGDISTTGLTMEILRQSDLSGVWFHEFLGSEAEGPDFNDIGATADTDGKLHISVSGHAPHTTSPGVLKKLKQVSKKAGLPFCIHAAESYQETEFISAGKGGWADLLQERNIDYSTWGLPCKSPVTYLHHHGLLDASTLVVHLTEATLEDFDIISGTGTKVCVCPRSNMNLHGKLPDLEKMFAKGILPALGTDSLASCDSLNVWDEMAYTAEHFQNQSPVRIFSMATQYGADALGMGGLTGSLEKGKRGEMLYVPVEAKSAKILLERITANEAKKIQGRQD